jgi:hypothetical protein
MKARQILLTLLIPMTAAWAGCSDVNTTPTAPTVRQPPQRVALAPVLSSQILPAVESMRIGETLSFSVKVELGEGPPPSSGGFPRWSSSNPGVISIDFNGKATAVGKGTATIEVIFVGHRTMRTIHVT